MMDEKTQIRFLQQIYAAAQAEAALQYEIDHIFEKVVERKRVRQMATGGIQAKKFNISKPEEVFSNLSELFGCVLWKIEKNEPKKEFDAVNKGCLLCRIAKQMGAPKICNMYCLDPMQRMIKAVAPDATYEIINTLWEEEPVECRIKIRRNV